MPAFTLAIPTYKRFDYLIVHLQRYLNSPNISEVIVCDDASTDYKQLAEIKFDNNHKLKLYLNDVNLGASKNKIKTVSLATSEWVLLLDSDNNISDETLGYLRNYEITDSKIVLSPSFAKPCFDYTKIKSELAIEDWKNMSNVESIFWNTGNYLVNKTLYEEAEKLVLESKVDPGPYDVVYINYFICKFLSGIFRILPEFQYNHTVNNDGIWITTHSSYDDWYNKFIQDAKTNA
jgi:glycosyltransferase involved in cell wall biosynthesis